MKLNYITLKNFRQYYGEQTIHFATDSYRHVTIIEGINGAGKTSLFTALNWCLYGSEFFKQDIGEFVSKYAQVNAETGEELRAVIATAGDKGNTENLNTSVELGFSYMGTEYCVRREYQWLRGGETIFTLKSKADQHPHQDSAASKLIESMIPKNVSVHYFFDGEKIDDFAKPGHEQEVKSAVRNILMIEAVDQGSKHLNQIARDIRSERKKLATGESKVLHQEREARQAELDKLTEEKKKLLEEVTSAKKQKLSVEAELGNIEVLRKSIDKEKEVAEKLKQTKEKKAGLQKKIRNLANRGFVPLARPIADKALKVLKESEIQNGITEPILEQIIHEMRCLCNRTIEQDSQEYQYIQNLFQQAVTPELEYSVRKTTDDLNRMLGEDVKNIPCALRSTLGEDQRLERDVEAIEANLENIQKGLEGFDHDEAKRLSASRAQYIENIEKLIGKINENKGKSQAKREQIDELDKKIKKLEVSAQREKFLKNCLELTTEAGSAMATIHELYADDTRQEVGVETQEIFQNLVWKDSQFEKVLLDADYALRVIDRFGKEARPEMSAGERQVLSLSFIAAIAKVAVKTRIPEMQSESFPILMDTPFGRLSTEHRENITATIPEIAPQMILLVTDEELHGKARENLKEYIGAEYKLHFDDSRGTTKIIEKIQ